MTGVRQRLAVYDDVLRSIRSLELVARAIPFERRDLRDQLRRASASIALNLAEGADEFSPLEKMRFYRMARRSAAECLSILDVLGQVVDPSPTYPKEREELLRILSTLANLVRSVELRAPRPTLNRRP